jgi:amphi-Trp domain-containing protein
MTASTELEVESEQSPAEVAEMLRRIADDMSGDEITVEGNDGAITVPGTTDRIKTELEATHEVKGEYSQVGVELELEWTIIPDEEDE